MNSLLLVLATIMSFSAFSASERITYNGARSEQSVHLEEDYYKDVTFTETVPVTRTICQDVPVTQNICEYVPPRQVCGSSPVCHYGPYGPICRPIYGCQVIPAGQVCRPVTVVSRQCGNQTRYERVTRTERRFQYRSKADIKFTFDTIPRGVSVVEFDVILENDQLDLSTYLPNGPIIIATLINREQERGGTYNRHYRISFMDRSEYLSPVAQIPVLNMSTHGEIAWRVNEEMSKGNVDISFRLKHSETLYELKLNVQNPNFYMSEDQNYLSISLSRTLGEYWRLWSNRILWLDLIIERKVNGQVINQEVEQLSRLTERYYL